MKSFKQLITVLFIFIGTTVIGQVLNPPSIGCIAVEDNGNTNIVWSSPSDPSGLFSAYHIYETDMLGNAQLIGSIGDYNVNSFYHNGADANNGFVCYYMVTESFDGSLYNSAPSDSACSIHMTMTYPNPPKFVDLAWNAPFIITQPPPGTEYEIWMEYPAGSWNQIGAVPWGTQTYHYDVDICDAFLSFQIRVDTGGGCLYHSNVDGADFLDETPPPETRVKAVTVDLLSQNAIVEWYPNDAADTYGYIVYQCVGNFDIPRDTIWDGNATTWEYLNSNAASLPEGFKVAAFDSCFSDTSGFNLGVAELECHRTIWLASSYGACDDFISLLWTQYIGFPQGVDTYDIYVSENGAPFEITATVDGTDQLFYFEGVNPGSDYSFYIQANAMGIDCISTSNISEVQIVDIPTPENVYLLSASYMEEDVNRIAVYTSDNTGTFLYHLERKALVTGLWENIAIQPAVGNTIIFEDLDSKNDIYSRDYRVITFNNCDEPVDTSNLGRTILLGGIANTGSLVNSITWNAYEDWEDGVDEYLIYRAIGKENTPELYGQVNGNVKFFKDDVSDLLYTSGEFCYIVEAHEDGAPAIIPGVSNSNLFCLVQDPIIWVPNAFMVNGFNNIFIPVISFADFETYEFTVFSRWGGSIFSTNDPTEGWDGTLNGELVPEGMYAFYLTLKDGEGRPYEQRGHVTLLIASEE